MHRPVILAAGSPQILLPWTNAGVFKRNLQYHIGPLASWTAWAVPTHMRTADIARRVGMPESDLRSLNHIPPSMLVRAGSTLLVPRDSSHKAEVPGLLADNGHVQLQPEVVRRKSTVKARKGETIATLAARLRLDAHDVAQWNKLQVGHRLKTGQALVVFRDSVVRTADAGRGQRASGNESKRVRAPAKSSRQKAAATPSRSSKSTAPKSSRKKK
jgi:membrane-bound lytic murein transglycosylase D